jgi:hypothetical protein
MLYSRISDATLAPSIRTTFLPTILDKNSWASLENCYVALAVDTAVTHGSKEMDDDEFEELWPAVLEFCQQLLLGRLSKTRGQSPSFS